MKNMNIMKRVVVRSLVKQSVLAFILLWAGFAFSADFNVDFHRKYQESTAEANFRSKKYPEAREAFEKLAATAKDTLEKTMWQARIAAAVGLQKDKLEEGLKLAKAIDDKPYSLYAQMEIMFAACDYKGIVSGFGSEDIAAWPPRRLAIVGNFSNGDTKDEDVRSMALYYRGYAYYKTGGGEAAEKDLEKAAEFAANDCQKAVILSALAAVEGQLLKNKEKAFAANMKITNIRGGSKHDPSFMSSFFGAAAYLREQKRYDEALDVLNRMSDIRILVCAWQEGLWLQDQYVAIGNTLAEAGRIEEAIAAYRQSCDDKFKDNSGISDARLALADTLAKAGKTEEAIAVYNTLIASEKNCRADIKAKAKTALEKLGKPAK